MNVWIPYMVVNTSVPLTFNRVIGRFPAHPTGKNKRQLIVKFTNYSARSRLYSNRKKLKEKHPKVYVNEDLTVQRFQLFIRLLELRKYKVVDNVWSNDGRLFAWSKGQKHLIISPRDIEKLASKD
jgi:hypothetical protein